MVCLRIGRLPAVTTIWLAGNRSWLVVGRVVGWLHTRGTITRHQSRTPRTSAVTAPQHPGGALFAVFVGLVSFPMPHTLNKYLFLTHLQWWSRDYISLCFGTGPTASVEFLRLSYSSP